MKNRNVLKVGSLEVPVSRAIYNAANCEFERVKKRDQRLRRDGLLYQEKSLSELYAETEYEPKSDDNVEQVAINNIFVEDLWRTISLALSEKDEFIIIAYYRDEITDQQIADILDISQQSVSKKRKKAEAKLRIILKDFKNF